MGRPTIYQITADMQAFDALLVEIDGDLTDPRVEIVVDEWMAELTGARDAKVAGYVRYITEAEARAKAKRAEARRLGKSAQVDENTAARLRTRLLDQMGEWGEQTIRTDHHTITVAKPGKPKVIVQIDPQDLPAHLRRIKAEPDKEAIRRVLDAGQLVDGCHLEPANPYLRIR